MKYRTVRGQNALLIKQSNKIVLWWGKETINIHIYISVQWVMEAEPISKEKGPFQGDLWRAISPIYYIGKVCGLVPVRFSPHTSEGCQARLNPIDLVYR